MDNPITPAPSARDVRRGRRYACRSSPLLKLLVRPSFQPQGAVARDVSQRGIGLFVARGLPVGARLALYARAAPRGDSCVLAARVVYAHCQGGGWLVGCELSRPLSDAEMASLV